MPVDIWGMSHALIITCSIVILIIIVLLFFIVLTRKRHNFHLKEKELMKSRYAQTLLQSQLEIQEQTFTQISNEIHDNIGQVLSLVRLNLNTLVSLPDEKKITRTDELLGKAINDLRNLSHNLNAEYIKETGLTRSVEKLLTSLAKTGEYEVSFKGTDNLKPCDERLIIVYRMIQEILSNIIKHAQATKIDITMEVTGRHLVIAVTDNGKGFDSNILNNKENGVGIRNIINRAKMICAEVTFNSVPAKGTIVTIHLSS